MRTRRKAEKRCDLPARADVQDRARPSTTIASAREATDLQRQSLSQLQQRRSAAKDEAKQMLLMQVLYPSNKRTLPSRRAAAQRREEARGDEGYIALLSSCSGHALNKGSTVWRVTGVVSIVYCTTSEHRKAMDGTRDAISEGQPHVSAWVGCPVARAAKAGCGHQDRSQRRQSNRHCRRR